MHVRISYDRGAFLSVDGVCFGAAVALAGVRDGCCADDALVLSCLYLNHCEMGKWTCCSCHH